MNMQQALSTHQQTVIRNTGVRFGQAIDFTQSQETGQRYIVINFGHRLTIETFVDTLIDAGFTELTCIVNGSQVSIPYSQLD